ncbi:MAG: penicillin acylase family protein [Acidobacteria bacterium]|nr:penicillin acylase family protein [Acidobacteriota bacterium]
MLRRILQALVAALSALALVFLVLFYWIAIRPLPLAVGQVSGPGFPAAAAGRDQFGVPHIEAPSTEEAVWVQGYVTAQDRLWQMDILRRVPAGQLSELLGPASLPADRESRTLGFQRAAAAVVRELPVNDLSVLAAYARGVNSFLESHRGNLPLEFRLLRYQPRPWTPSDSILVAMQMFRTLSTSWKDDLLKWSLLSRAPAQKVEALLPVRSGREFSPGSNAWAVSGAHTTSGKPLFANDPHLDYSIPCIWYTVHLKAPGFNVIGVSIPGLPGVIIGHNDRIAWGATNLHFDVQDLYMVQTVERREQEVIRVRGQADDLLPVELTPHGPVIAESQKQKFALRWTAMDSASWQYPFLEMDRAGNWQGFRAALARYRGPAQNWVYADVDGNIGYQAAGRLPIRKGFDGSVPVPSDGRFEWQGYIPFEELPRAYNPGSGIIVTANQNPFPPDYPYTVNGNFAPHFRANRIQELLEKARRFEAADFLHIQTDVYSAFGHAFAQELLASLERRKPAEPGLASVAAELRGWDGQFRREQRAPVVVTAAYNRFLHRLVEGIAGDMAGLYTSQMGTVVVEQVLSTRPPGWIGDYDELLLTSLRDSVQELGRTPGGSLTWGQYLETTLAHPIGHRIPLLRRWFDIGPFPQAGATTTIKQTTKRMGPSMRLIVDLADQDRSLHNITTGESGQPFSRHYKDQWPAYFEGRSFPLPFKSPQIVERLTFVPSR